MAASEVHTAYRIPLRVLSALKARGGVSDFSKQAGYMFLLLCVVRHENKSLFLPYYHATVVMSIIRDTLSCFV